MKNLTLQERIWKELKKYGIHNEKELDEELEKKINKIIKNNKDKYTYLRYYNIVSNNSVDK